METQKFQLGPIQTAWVKSLKEHPERQITGRLGGGTLDYYHACCLGDLLVCAHKVAPDIHPNPFNSGTNKILDGSGDAALLIKSWKLLGLNSTGGRITNGTLYEFASLASANDAGVSWQTIAEFIEANPEKVFTKSV